MGGADKGLMPIAGQPAVRHLQQRLQPPLLRVSANRHVADYQLLGITPVPDRRPGFCGPLAGLEALLYAADDTPAVLVPCDMPWLPANLPVRLLSLLDARGTVVVAHDGEQLQPLCLAFYPADWRDDLSRYLDDGRRSAQGWLADKPVRLCRFDHPEAFSNLNTTEQARSLAGADPGVLR